jgi:hypothetical protein
VSIKRTEVHFEERLTIKALTMMVVSMYRNSKATSTASIKNTRESIKK